MEFAVLGLLVISNRTIYEMNAAFKQSISLIYSASYGALQSAIKRLVSRGLADFTETVESGRNKKSYHITPKGQDAFFEWIKSPVNKSRLEVEALSRLHFLGLISDKSERLCIIDGISLAIEEALAGLKALKSDFDEVEVNAKHADIFRFQIATLEYGIASHESARDWFAQLREQIEG